MSRGRTKSIATVETWNNLRKQGIWRFVLRYTAVCTVICVFLSLLIEFGIYQQTGEMLFLETLLSAVSKGMVIGAICALFSWYFTKLKYLKWLEKRRIAK